MAKAAVAESVRNGTSKLQVEAAKARQAAEQAAAAGQVEASNLAIIAKQREAAAYAEAAEIEGAATTTALGPIGWFIAAVVALGVAIYYTFNHFQRLTDQQANLAAAMGNGADKTEQQTKRMDEMAEAARKLAVEIANVHKHEKTLAQISDEAVESLRRNAQAKADIAKEAKQIRLDEIELAEKMHKISAQEATRQRAALEIESAKEEQALKVKALTDETNQRNADLKKATEADAAATADYKAKHDKSTTSGAQGKAEIDALAELKKREADLSKQADALIEQRQGNDGIWGGMVETAVRGAAWLRGNKFEDTQYANRSVTVDGKEMPYAKLEDVQAQLAAVRANAAKASSSMSGSDIATAEAKAKMESAQSSKLSLQNNADKAAQALADAQKNGSAILAAKIQDIELKRSAKLYEQGQQGITQGFSLNSQQRLGAYSATPPDFKKLVDAAVETAVNSRNWKPNSFNPVGSTPAKFGPGHH
jgi:hypothetical protein